MYEEKYLQVWPKCGIEFLQSSQESPVGGSLLLQSEQRKLVFEMESILVKMEHS